MKVVILAGGYGSRMGDLTKHIPKHMLPICGKPILEWNIEFIRDQLKCEEIIIVTGYKENIIKKHFEEGSKFRVRITYLTQDIYKNPGLAAALKCAKNNVDGDFIVILGDNLYKGEFDNIIKRHNELNATATIHAEEVNEPSRYGVISMKDVRDSIILRVDEKPENPKSNLVITGFYIFNQEIFSAIDKISPSSRGELELTDAINYLCLYGNVHVDKMNGWRKDIGYAEDLLEASIWIFKNQDVEYENILSEVDQSNKLLQPVYIGKNCRIINSVIGPNTSIGDNVIIENSKVSKSIILDDRKLFNEVVINQII